MRVVLLLSLILIGCGHDPGSQLSSPPAKPFKTELPAPTPPANESLLNRYLEENSPEQRESLAQTLVSQVFQDPGQVSIQIQSLRADLQDRKSNGAYTDESKTRVERLNELFELHAQELNRSLRKQDLIFIAVSSAGLGALSGLHAFNYVSRIAPGMGRIGSRAASRIAGLWRTLSMDEPQYAYKALHEFGVPEDLTATLDLEPTRAGDMLGFNFEETELAGFRYSILHEWFGRDLGEHRILALEVRRALPGRGKYLVSNELDAAQAETLTKALRQSGQERKFLYELDQSIGVWRPIPVLVDKIRPLFKEFDFPMGAGTTALSGLIGVTALKQGSENAPIDVRLF